MRLIVVRHGETEWNQQKRTQGMSDTPLAPRGHRQALRLAARLRSMPVQCVFSSPLARAVDTAKALTLHRNWPIMVDSDLREINFGSWEGLTFEEIGKNYPDELAVWNASPDRCQPPGEGETLSQVAERVDAFLERAKAKYTGKIVLAVTHSIPCKLLIARTIGLPLQNLHALRVDNVSMSILDFYQDRSVLRLCNDTTHLQEGVLWPRRS